MDSNMFPLEVAVQFSVCRNSVSIPLMGMLLVSSVCSTRAQGPQKQGSAAQLSSGPSSEVRAMTESIRALDAQVQTLIAQINDMKSEQQRTLQEARNLRHELEALKAHPIAAEAQAQSTYALPERAESTPAAHPTFFPAGQTLAADPTVVEKLTKLEENQQFIDEKVAVQEQSKVESGSKYHARLSGIVLFNLYGNHGNVDNQDFPQVAIPAGTVESNHAMGASLRQSQVGFEVFGPDIAGARTSANVRFDFAGGFPNVPNGAGTGLVRLRTGTMRLDWKKASLIAGQDALFIAPLTPTSIASLAIPAMSYAGNLWSWIPQVRVEHRFVVSENSVFTLQGGILDSFSGDTPSSSYGRDPSWGEQSGQPAYAARVAWTGRTRGQQWTIGTGGLYARQFWGFGRNLDSWTSTLDLSLGLGRFFGFTGAFYRGRALGGFGGGIGQSVLFSGSLVDPATRVRGLNSMGGWTQLKFKPTPKFEMNAAFGQDNPFASELRASPIVPSEYSEALSRNQIWFTNFIYRARSNVLLSLEFRRIKTTEAEGDGYAAHHLNLAVGYIF